MSDLEQQSQNITLKYLIQNFTLRTSDSGWYIHNIRFKILYSEYHVLNIRIRISDSVYQIRNTRVRSSDSEFQIPNKEQNMYLKGRTELKWPNLVASLRILSSISSSIISFCSRSSTISFTSRSQSIDTCQAQNTFKG